jgi:hypothetical protein
MPMQVVEPAAGAMARYLGPIMDGAAKGNLLARSSSTCTWLM